MCKILCAQFGNRQAGIQIVVDTLTTDICHYKEILETKLIIGHNLKFDIQFLYNHNIIPTQVWDTMIIEQLLHLGFDNKFFHYSLLLSVNHQILYSAVNLTYDCSAVILSLSNIS